MTRRSNYQEPYAPRLPWWMWLGFASRNARRGIIFGAFLGLLLRVFMRTAVFLLRTVVRGVELAFRVSEQTALAIVVSFLLGVLAGVLLLSDKPLFDTTHAVRAVLSGR